MRVMAATPPRLGELQVHKRDVRLQATMKLYGLKAIARFSNNFDLGHDFEQCDEALSHHMVVLYYHDPDSICHLLFPSVRQWSAQRDSSAALWRAFNLQSPTDLNGALAHSLKSEVPFCNESCVRRVETTTVVGDLQCELAWMIPQVEFRVGRSGMADHICERLLSDSEYFVLK